MVIQPKRQKYGLAIDLIQTGLQSPEFFLLKEGTHHEANDKQKIVWSFAIVLCLLVMVSVISIAKMSGMGREADSIENKWMPSVKTLADMQADMYAIQHTLMSMVMESDDYQMKSYQSQLNDSIAELKTIQKKYESDYVSNEDESKIIHQFMEAEEQYLKVFPEVIQARKKLRSGHCKFSYIPIIP